MTLVGCKNDADVIFGTLEIHIDSFGSKGIQAVSMETASYNVTVTDSSENIVFASSRKTQTSITISVQAGTYYVYVEALNSDGIVIGTGTASCGVVAGQTNSFSITVSESYGEGIFAISIKANFLPQIVVYFYRADGTLVRRETPPYVDGKYESSFRIHNGFYSFAVVRADTEQVLHRDTVRIIKDTTATYSAECIILNDGTISIINEMQETPVISITLDKSVYDNTETLNASAVIEGITGNSFYWTVDGVIQGTTDSYKDLSLSLSEMDEGNHEIALFVSDGTVVWAENASFTIGGCFNIGYIDPDFDPENTTWYVNKADGDSFEIRMNNDGSACVYYPSILDTYFRSMYGWFPTSGNPFNFYYQDQLGMSKAEFISALVERSVDLPYPNYVPHLSHPYIVTNEQALPEGLSITDVQTIYSADKGYFREYETCSIFDFPEADRIYVGAAKSGDNYCYKILVPEEVISVYREKYPTKTFTERVASYFSELYGIDVMTDDGGILFTREQIAAVLSEYKSPNLVRIRLVVQPAAQDLAESLEGTNGFVDVGSKLLGWGSLNSTDGWDYIYYEDFEDGDVLTISPWQGYMDDEDIIHRCDVPTCKIVSLNQVITISSDKVNTIYLQVKSLEDSDDFTLDYNTDFCVTDYPYTIPHGEAGVKYVIDVAKANNVSYDCYGSNLPVYTTTGLHRDNFIPIPAQEPNHFVMYIGEITDEMRFRISAYDLSDSVNDYGTFKIRPAIAEELAYITETEVTEQPFEIPIDLEERASYIRRYVLSGTEEITSVALFFSTDGENYSEYDSDTVGFHIGFRSGDINGSDTGYNCTCGGESVLTSSYPIEVVEIDGTSQINGKLKIVLN